MGVASRAAPMALLSLRAQRGISPLEFEQFHNCFFVLSHLRLHGSFVQMVDEGGNRGHFGFPQRNARRGSEFRQFSQNSRFVQFRHADETPVGEPRFLRGRFPDDTTGIPAVLHHIAGDVLQMVLFQLVSFAAKIQTWLASMKRCATSYGFSPGRKEIDNCRSPAGVSISTGKVYVTPPGLPHHWLL